MTDIVFNHATVRERADMLTFLRLCSERGLQTVSIWGDEIAKVGETDALSVLNDFGMTVSGYNRVGPLAADALDRAEAELERAARFKADHVFLFTGGLRENEKDLSCARRRIEDLVGSVLERARNIGVKLAIEPLHPMLTGDRTVISSLSHANSLCEALGPGIGVVVDVYHCWWDERLAAEIEGAGRAGRLFGFHVNDWLIPTRHLLTDRGMMGGWDHRSARHPLDDARCRLRWRGGGRDLLHRLVGSRPCRGDGHCARSLPWLVQQGIKLCE